MKIEIKRTWETVFFTAENKGESSTVELNLNHETGSFTITQAHEEGLRFNGDDVVTAELKLKAALAALKYIKNG